MNKNKYLFKTNSSIRDINLSTSILKAVQFNIEKVVLYLDDT